MLEYRKIGSELLSEVYAMYQAEGWDLYSDPGKIKRAWDRSLYSLGAFDGGKLIGFIRCLGDGEYDLYVSDLLVAKEHRGKGVGRSLMEQIMAEFSQVDTFALMTGLEEEQNQAFCRSLGMKEYSDNRLIGFLR